MTKFGIVAPVVEGSTTPPITRGAPESPKLLRSPICAVAHAKYEKR